jgi:UDP-glucose:(heptosyl)LPS alpha-1,3-glucosyltransferase
MRTNGNAQNPRLRIALLVDRFGRHFGGAEAYGVELVRELAKRHDVTVVARDYDCDLRVPYLPIRVSRLPGWLRLWYFAWRARRLTRGRFDIVHSHVSAGVGNVQVVHVTPVRYKRCHGARPAKRFLAWLSPRVVTYLWLERKRVQAVSGPGLVAVSALIAQQMRESYGGGLAIDIIPPGVYPAGPPDPDRRRATRQGLGWDDDTIGCLLVARNPLRKGLAALLDALDRLPQAYRLLVVGTAEDAARAACAARVSHGRVVLLGPTPNVATYYEAADIYVHPTLGDSFGMGPLEAMAHRLPVVLSGAAYCGFAAYLRHEEDALILDDPRDGAALAQALQRLATDAALRGKLVVRGAQVVARHSWKATAERYEALYANILRLERSGRSTATSAASSTGSSTASSAASSAGAYGRDFDRDDCR